jgi:hypothetical protein
MLGRLARWLRLLGYDTLYRRDWDDAELARVAVRDGRVLLTRDRELAGRRIVRNALLVDVDDPEEQLRFVVRSLELAPDLSRMFSRCAHCNAAVEPVGPDEVEGRVPAYVRRHCDRFARCPECGRVYWNGTHQRLARSRIARILGVSPRA